LLVTSDLGKILGRLDVPKTVSRPRPTPGTTQYFAVSSATNGRIGTMSGVSLRMAVV